MKRIDLGLTISILANVGVIAGIAFLAVEISQTNGQLAAQARNTLWELRADLERDFMNNVGEIADIRTKAIRGEALTDVEEAQLNSRRYHMLRTFEYMVQESPGGAQIHAAYMAAMFREDAAMIELWNRLAAARELDPEFVRFMREIVLPRVN